MSKLKILIVNDFASTAFLFERRLSSEISAIYFDQHAVISPVKHSMYFASDDLAS